MSDLKRYRCTGPEELVETSSPNGLVLGSNYDAAQSELSALREELASQVMTIQELAGANDDLQQRLAAAEQRNSELVELLSKAKLAVDDVAENCEDQTDWSTANSMHSLSERIDAAIKPTESGASE